MTIQEKYRFDYRRVEALLQRRIESIAKRAGQSYEQKFHVVRSFFRRVLFCVVEGIILLPLLSTRRPPERKLVALGERDSDFLDPSSRLEEYQELARLLAVSSEEEAVIYHQVTQFDFAVVEKHSMLARIADDRDAGVYGFSLEGKEKELLQQGFSLRWQEWGGVISKCRFGEKPTLVSSFESVRRGIGRCKRLPVSLVR